MVVVRVLKASVRVSVLSGTVRVRGVPHAYRTGDRFLDDVTSLTCNIICTGSWIVRTHYNICKIIFDRGVDVQNRDVVHAEHLVSQCS